MGKNGSIKIDPQSSGFGAAVRGVNLSGELTSSLVDQIKGIWHKYGVICFPDQNLDVSALEAFTEAMGGYGVSDFVIPMEGHKNILELRREPEETASHFGGSWHSDFSYQKEPPAATILYGHIVPPVGGDTLYADGRAAYLALSDTMKGFLESLQGIHSAVSIYSKEGFFGSDQDTTRTIKIVPSDVARETQLHPVIRTHPATGEKILWINPNYMLGFEGLTDEESQALLGFLADFTTKDEFVYRHRWQTNMLTMWDNRRVQHFADTGFDGHRRVMWRTTTAGTVPV